jgi:NTE family protein
MNPLRRLDWKLRPPVLALGGGGARGFAHLGVLEVLEKEGLPIRAIAGTSMGAVIGAMYILHGSTEEVIKRWREALGKKLIPTVPTLLATREQGAREHPLWQAARRIKSRIVISMAVNRSTMLDGAPLTQVIEYLLGDTRFEDLDRPLIAVATDLETGDEVHLRKGLLGPAIQASSSIPGLLPAIEIDGRVLVDGAVKAEVPIAAARTLGRPVVAVDVSMDLPPLRVGGLVLDTMMRTQLMTSIRLRRLQLKTARRIIRPEVGHATWAEWGRLNEMLEAGRCAARAWLDRGLLRR